MYPANKVEVGTSGADVINDILGAGTRGLNENEPDTDTVLDDKDGDNEADKEEDELLDPCAD